MKKLYDEDSYITEFSAKVVSCTPHKDGFSVLLDQTAFFPTAGGQSCDTGTLCGETVLDVTISDDNVYHYVKNPIETGKTVTGKIDKAVRFRKMQHHSGEHIVSGVVFSEFGFNNVGFHLSETEVTMDYDGELTRDDILRIERLSNGYVQKNLEIFASYPKKEEIEKIDYRSKKELSGDIRIVTIPGVDTCACCAPHVKRTGEIGVIKIVDAFRHRGGMRLTMICGMDAVADYQKKQETVLKISNVLSKKQSEIAESAEKLLSDFGEAKQKINELNKEIMRIKAENVPAAKGNLCVFLDDCDRNKMRYFAEFAMEKVSGILAVLSKNQKGGYDYILASKSVELRDVSKEINEALSGRGGGKDFIEGTFNKEKKEIESYFKTVSF